MAILSAMSNREASRVGEPVRRAVYHLGYHCKRLHGSRADTRRQQQIGKVFRSSVGSGCEISTEPPRNHVFASDIVMRRHHQVWQKRLGDSYRGLRPAACFKH
jgi:hypothetical protein